MVCHASVVAKQTNHALRILRAKRHISQLNTALELGWGQTKYWKIENGYQQPTEKERAELAAFFGEDAFLQEVGQ